jgi:hypothetical protein
MSKESKPSRVLPVNVSYDLLNYMRGNMVLNSYTVKSATGEKKAILTLTYRTTDGKLHQVFNTEVTL